MRRSKSFQNPFILQLVTNHTTSKSSKSLDKCPEQFDIFESGTKQAQPKPFKKSSILNDYCPNMIIQYSGLLFQIGVLKALKGTNSQLRANRKFEIKNQDFVNWMRQIIKNVHSKIFDRNNQNERPFFSSLSNFFSKSFTGDFDDFDVQVKVQNRKEFMEKLEAGIKQCHDFLIIEDFFGPIVTKNIEDSKNSQKKATEEKIYAVFESKSNFFHENSIITDYFKDPDSLDQTAKNVLQLIKQLFVLKHEKFQVKLKENQSDIVKNQLQRNFNIRLSSKNIVEKQQDIPLQMFLVINKDLSKKQFKQKIEPFRKFLEFFFKKAQVKLNVIGMIDRARIQNKKIKQSVQGLEEKMAQKDYEMKYLSKQMEQKDKKMNEKITQKDDEMKSLRKQMEQKDKKMNEKIAQLQQLISVMSNNKNN